MSVMQGSKRRTTIALAQRYTLDRLGLTALLSLQHDLTVLATVEPLNEYLQLCSELHPHVAVVDARYPDNGAYEVAEELIRERWAKGVLILDDEVRISRVLRAQQLDHVSYYSKFSNLTDVLEAIRKLSRGQASFDPSIRDRIINDTQGRPKRLRVDGPSIAVLTTRELQVMKLTAEGLTGREVAQHMSLSPSTVDNHKARLMKKLDIHKLSQLTRIAVQEGLLDSPD